MRAEAYTRLTHSTANKRIVPCYIIVACTGVRCSDCNQPSCTYRACYREMLINRSETVQRKFPCSRKRLQIRVRTSNGLAAEPFTRKQTLEHIQTTTAAHTFAPFAKHTRGMMAHTTPTPPSQMRQTIEAFVRMTSHTRHPVCVFW